MPGCLYLVSTPIGNLGDFSHRGVETLANCDLIACESVRKTMRLLNHYGIRGKTTTYNERNERRRAIELAEQIEAGSSIALVAEAGTPGISDPGFRIVRECHRRKLPVVPIPGASAFTAALSAAGLPTDHFEFIGFLPSKSASRCRLFERHRDVSHTLIFFESRHRIAACLADLECVLGSERTIAVARELTKTFESFYIGRLAEVRSEVLADHQKGEYVILVAKEEYQL